MEKLHTNYPLGALAEALEVSRSARAACARRCSSRSSCRALHAAAAPMAARACSAICASSCERCGKNRVARLMRAQGLRARQKRGFRPRTTDSRHGNPIAENWLARVPAPDAPGRVWQSD